MGQENRRLRQPLSHVLVVDDSPIILEMIGSQLSAWGYSVRMAEGGPRGLELLRSEVFDVIVSDVQMPEISGLVVLAEAQAYCPEVPVIMLSSASDMDIVLQAIHQGAFDYVLKDQRLEPLQNSIERAIERKRLVQENRMLVESLQRMNTRLAKQATVDPLTGMINRRGLDDIFSTLISMVRRGNSLIAILIDCDDFKSVNDRFGYVVGDMLLREMATRIKGAIRPTDYAARLGGDEFLVFLPETREAEGVHIAERLRLELNKTPLEVSLVQVRTSASLGVVKVNEEIPSLDEVVSRAHVALTRSKSLGKNRVSTFQADLGAAAASEVQPLDEFVDALSQESPFCTVGQAIIDLDRERAVGYELLCRGPEGSFNMPAEFLRAAFDANVLTAVDLRCLRACLDAATQAPAGAPVHVNVYPSTLLNTPRAQLLDLFPRDADAPRVCVEISEQQLIGDPSSLVDVVTALKEAGLLVALDDIGYGRSSIESLIVLEPDIIKLDLSCVRNCSKDPSKEDILNRLLTVAHALGAEAVAVGVESRDDLNTLRRLGFKSAQGFLWGEPVADFAARWPVEGLQRERGGR